MIPQSIALTITPRALNIINNRAIQFVKEGNISKTACENMRKPSLLEGCTDWHVGTDLKHNFLLPTEIALTTKRPDIVIWSVKAKEFSLLSERSLLKKISTGHIRVSWKNMKICENNVSEMVG